MAQMQDEAGNIWEVDAQGNAIALVRQAGGGVSIRPNDPYAGIKAQGQELNNQRLQQQIGSTAATAPYDAQRARADAAKAEIDAEKARRDLAAQQSLSLIHI